MIRRILFLALAFALAGPSTSRAQQSFTVDDVFNVTSVSLESLSPNGRWAVVSSLDLRGRLGTNSHRTGDPTYVSPSAGAVWLLDARTGAQVALAPEQPEVAAAVWSPSSERLAVVAYDRDSETYRLGVAARAGDGDPDIEWIELPVSMRLAGEQGQAPKWAEGGDALLLPVRPERWYEQAQAEVARLIEGPITVYRGDDPFLAWEALRRRGAEVALVCYDLASRETHQVLDATPLARGGFRIADGHVVYEADVTEKTSYDVIFGADAEVRMRPLAGGSPSVIASVPEDRRLTWSKDNSTYAYSKEGTVYLGRLDGSDPVQLTGLEEDGSVDSADAAAEDSDDDRERFSVVGVAHDGSAVAASTKSGFWLIDVESKRRTHMIALSEDEDEAKTAPSYSLRAWADNGDLYFQRDSSTEWNRGMVRWDHEGDQLVELFANDRLYSGFELSEDGTTWVYLASAGNRPYDLYAADADFGNERKLLTTNPQLASRALGATELIDYLDVDGDRLHGVLYYPADYIPGTAVPTIFLVYEEFFDDRFNSTIALLNANGYAVMQPSVDLEVGFPAEAWLKGVTAAANTLIEKGIADPDRLGVHGTSYGGYATNLLVTQTDRFAAAINISGKVNMISFYTDSPRLGVRNIHAPENSQDRIGATLWEQPQKYIAHSAIMAADRIETPLLLMTGEQDHNVPARTTLEMYYALRRLGKTVEWVNYINGGHGMPRTTEAEVRDYHERILEWYARYLKDGEKATTQDGS